MTDKKKLADLEKKLAATRKKLEKCASDVEKAKQAEHECIIEETGIIQEIEKLRPSNFYHIQAYLNAQKAQQETENESAQESENT